VAGTEHRDADFAAIAWRSLMDRRKFLAALGLGSVGLFPLQAHARTAGSSRNTWRRDGSGWRARIGVLTPANDPVPESEFWTMAPEGVSVHAARVPLVDVKTFSNPPYADDATGLLAALPLNAIVFAFTTSSYVLGPKGEQELTARLEKRSKGIPVLLPCVAAVTAFHLLAVRRIALIHPPWFAEGVIQRGATYFRNQGFDVTHAGQLFPTRKFTEVHPAELYAWVHNHVPKEAEAVFIAGNGLRAIGTISALEEDLGRAVLTANQVSFWYALRQVGVHALVDGYGRLFSH
jgi:maleate isomerase